MVLNLIVISIFSSYLDWLTSHYFCALHNSYITVLQEDLQSIISQYFYLLQMLISTKTDIKIACHVRSIHVSTGVKYLISFFHFQRWNAGLGQTAQSHVENCAFQYNTNRETENPQFARVHESAFYTATSMYFIAKIMSHFPCANSFFLSICSRDFEYHWIVFRRHLWPYLWLQKRYPLR